MIKTFNLYENNQSSDILRYGLSLLDDIDKEVNSINNNYETIYTKYNYSIIIYDSELYIIDLDDDEYIFVYQPGKIVKEITESYLDGYHTKKDYLMYVARVAELIEIYLSFVDESRETVYNSKEYKNYKKNITKKQFNI